ncbi:STAS domain-containing protein [Streptomyces axinellae]|uniref:Anti-sigma factor antagonist n=1 Tax=Streptomyces axinellae TaxID=552788 RepID=A0ABP6CAF6_9ACTN
MHIRGDHAELVVGGRLDVRSAADARTVLHAAVDSGDGDLVLDLAELDSWDATGLGVIMGAHRRAGRCGRRLVLREVPPQMQRLLMATRLHRILAIETAAVPSGRRMPEKTAAPEEPVEDTGAVASGSRNSDIRILTKP